MSIELNHTIVPSRDKDKAARFFARIFGLSYDGPHSHFAPVRVNDRLTLDFDNDDSFVGERYGVPTPECLEAIRTTARTEGLLLDPVYTGKAMAALFSHVREGELTKADSPIVFLHTGGYSALFGYAKDVLK